jgi:hypothetical protein
MAIQKANGKGKGKADKTVDHEAAKAFWKAAFSKAKLGANGDASSAVPVATEKDDSTPKLVDVKFANNKMKTYDYLEYIQSDEAGKLTGYLRCKYCAKYGLAKAEASSGKVNTRFITGFCFQDEWKKRPAKFSEHASTNFHADAKSAYESSLKVENVGKGLYADPGLIHTHLVNANDASILTPQVEIVLERRMRTSHLVGKENMALRKYGKIVLLQQKNGLDMGAQHLKDDGCDIYLSVIAGELFHAKTAAFNANGGVRFFGILSDGTPGKHDHVEHEGVYVRFVDYSTGEPTTPFIGLNALKNQKWEGVVDGILEEVSKLGIDRQRMLRGLAFLCLDGASVNMGKYHSVKAYFQREFPWVIVIHCINHALELAISDLKKADEHFCLFNDTLKDVFLLFHCSTKKRRELFQLADTLDQSISRLGGIQGIRWLASQFRAVDQMYENYEMVVTYMEQLALDRTEERATEYEGILNNLKSLTFVRFLVFMKDFLPPLKRVSESFQGSKKLLARTVSSITDAKEQLLNLKNGTGVFMSAFATEQVNYEDRTWRNICVDGGDRRGSRTRGICTEHISSAELLEAASRSHQKSTVMFSSFNNFIDSTILYLDERFKAFFEEPLQAFVIFDYKHMAWPAIDSEEFRTWGNEQVGNIVQHFRNLLSPTEMLEIRSQWPLLRKHIARNSRAEPYILYTNLLLDNKKGGEHKDFQEALLLVELMMSFQDSNAIVERGFSKFSEIVTAKRARMVQHKKNKLMHISIDSVDVEDFDPKAPLAYWQRKTNEVLTGPSAVKTLNQKDFMGAKVPLLSNVQRYEVVAKDLHAAKKQKKEIQKEIKHLRDEMRGGHH